MLLRGPEMWAEIQLLHTLNSQTPYHKYMGISITNLVNTLCERS